VAIIPTKFFWNWESFALDYAVPSLKYRGLPSVISALPLFRIVTVSAEMSMGKIDTVKEIGLGHS